jgi:membrane-bound lytic murein transglycosylase B
MASSIKKWGTIAIMGITLSACATQQQLPSEPPLSWVQQTEQQALDDGVSAATVHEALDHFIPNPHIVELDKKQPETTITFASYRHNIVTSSRIQKGAELMRLYSSELAAIEQRTGVPPQIVVALWGVESSFGQNMGSYETINSLATLAYEGRRADFFRSELIAALHILDQEHMSSHDLHGSWAGAMGQCQFMPSTYLKYAVDGDGRRDIWNNTMDVLASIANYLEAVGWKRDLEWGYLIESSDVASFPVGSVMQPDGPQGESFVTTDNVRALMRWNHSSYFVLSVGLLSDAIKNN